jgi:hypothetical protein
MNFDINTIEELKVKPHPNSDLFQEITKAIKDNDEYCCCAMEKNDDTKCMCLNFREQTEGGFCHCGRFFKYKEFPIITILCHPKDADEADSIAENLVPQGFIVLTPRYVNEGWYAKKKKVLDEIQRTQIFKADLVFVINSNQEAVDFLEEQIYWAEDLQKKIIYQYTEEVKENEVRAD